MTLARGDCLADLGQWPRARQAIIFLVFGATKLGVTAGIAPLVMNSPFVSWWHTVFGVGRRS